MASITAITKAHLTNLQPQHEIKKTTKTTCWSPTSLIRSPIPSSSRSLLSFTNSTCLTPVVEKSTGRNTSSFASTAAVRHLIGSVIRTEGLRFAIVVARFNEVVTKLLLEGALETFKRYAVREEDIDVVWVPGSFEIPVVAERLGKTRKYQAVLCIGAVVRGDTTHYDAVANSAASGVLSAGLNSDLLPGWKETMEKYHSEALRVAKEVAKIIALALDLDADFFEKPEMLGESIATLRLLHYEGVITDRVSNPEKGIYGAGAHSDYGLITLLATDDVWGLQICKDKDARPQIWEYVAPMKGAFIVNLGDMLERWSNCIFRSTLHRVLANGQERYSIAFFVEPSHECVVECLPSCKSETNPPKFPPVMCGTYLTQRYKDTHSDLSSYQKHKV